MKLQLAVEFSTGNSFEGGVYMSTNWGIEAAKKLKERDSERWRNEETQREHRKRMEEQGPNLWIELCEFIKQKCVELNENYGAVVIFVKDTRLNHLEARFEHSGGITTLEVKFEATTSQKALSWTYGGNKGRNAKSGSCQLFVNPDGRVTFQQTTPESLADVILDGLIAE